MGPVPVAGPVPLSLMELLFQTDRENLDFLYTQAYFSSAGAFLAHVRRKELVSAGFWDWWISSSRTIPPKPGGTD